MNTKPSLWKTHPSIKPLRTENLPVAKKDWKGLVLWKYIKKYRVRETHARYICFQRLQKIFVPQFLPFSSAKRQDKGSPLESWQGRNGWAADWISSSLGSHLVVLLRLHRIKGSRVREIPPYRISSSVYPRRGSRPGLAARWRIGVQQHALSLLCHTMKYHDFKIPSLLPSL